MRIHPPDQLRGIDRASRVCQKSGMNEKPSRIKRIELAFESMLWSCRFIVLLGVLFGVVASVSVFVVGSMDIYHVVRDQIRGDLKDPAQLLAYIIGAVDYYLIGVVLLIFSFGIYELFISPLEVARRNTDVQILEVKDLDELKNKIIKVVIMVLVVSFFKKVLSTEYKGALEMMYFAFSIFAISFGVYFLHRAH
jgi:uncharacterized membrane protein YqhA